MNIASPRILGMRVMAEQPDRWWTRAELTEATNIPVESWYYVMRRLGTAGYITSRRESELQNSRVQYRITPTGLRWIQAHKPIDTCPPQRYIDG